MPLFIYRANAANHVHENEQFIEVCNLLKKKYGGKEEFCLYIPNFSLYTKDFDGLIIIANAIIILELKNYSHGKVEARENGSWIFTNKKSGTPIDIKGGAANKTVLNQAKNNFDVAFGHFSNKYFSGKLDKKSLFSLVCFSHDIEIENQLQKTTKWIKICCLDNFVEVLDTIVSKELSISQRRLFEIIQSEKLSEFDIMLQYSDVDKLPPNLYNPDHFHGGDNFKITKNVSQEQIDDLFQKYVTLSSELEITKNQLQQEVNIRQYNEHRLNTMRTQMDEKDKLIEDLENRQRVQQQKCDDLEVKNSLFEEELDSVKKQAEQFNIDLNAQTIITESIRTPRNTGHRRRLKPFCVDWDKVNNDDEEMRAIKESMDKHLIVTGCAGSGKSIVALYKAKAIQDAGHSYCVIVFNKTLKDYMSAGFVDLKLTGKVYTRGEWEKLQRPKVDYIIVDEVQDFSIEEIRNMRLAAKKYMFMFGDSNQSIYQSLRPTTTIEELCEEFDIVSPLILNNCYRLPKSVAPLLPYVLKGVEYVEGRYKNENANTPYIIQAESYNEQLRIIQQDIIKKGNLKEVGILLPSNDMVLQVASELVVNGMEVEIRYRGDDVEKGKQFDTLNFNNTAPKIMTYHSAKGLQFETVIIPLCPSFKSLAELKRLYVAMSRTYRNLYILYSGDMPTPLNEIPTFLYKNSLLV